MGSENRSFKHSRAEKRKTQDGFKGKAESRVSQNRSGFSDYKPNVSTKQSVLPSTAKTDNVTNFELNDSGNNNVHRSIGVDQKNDTF